MKNKKSKVSQRVQENPEPQPNEDDEISLITYKTEIVKLDQEQVEDHMKRKGKNVMILLVSSAGALCFFILLWISVFIECVDNFFQLHVKWAPGVLGLSFLILCMTGFAGISLFFESMLDKTDISTSQENPIPVTNKRNIAKPRVVKRIQYEYPQDSTISGFEKFIIDNGTTKNIQYWIAAFRFACCCCGIVILFIFWGGSLAFQYSFFDTKNKQISLPIKNPKIFSLIIEGVLLANAGLAFYLQTKFL